VTMAYTRISQQYRHLPEATNTHRTFGWAV
jgi:hypothetical protein